MSRRLPSLKPRDVIRTLERAGFFVDHIHGSHHYLKHPEKLMLLVVVPYHPRDIKRGLLHAIIKQAGMTVEEFVGLL